VLPGISRDQGRAGTRAGTRAEPGPIPV